MVSLLATQLRPRYHFAGSEGVFFTRLPYKNEGAGASVTRFIGLGTVFPAGSPLAADKAKKYLHALNLTSLTEVDCTSETN